MPARMPDLAPILDLLACPACSGTLTAEANELACSACGLLYPIIDGIPILLIDRATQMTPPDRER